MSRSTILIVCLSIAVGYILATALNRTFAGQPPPPEAVVQQGQVWRYQLTGAGGDSFATMFVTDTVTGKVWWRESDERERGAWRSYGSPASIQPDHVPR
jgi:hypothetical protein